MKLFDLKNYSLTISEEAYALKAFKTLWERDKTATKTKAIGELSYVFHMEDFRSDYSDILDESERSSEVLSQLSLPKDWKEDQKVRDARRYYEERSNELISLQFLRDAKFAVNKIREFFREVDLLATDPRGKPIHDVAKLERVLSNSASILKNLKELEEEVKRDIDSISNVRGGKIKNIFEDGI